MLQRAIPALYAHLDRVLRSAMLTCCLCKEYHQSGGPQRPNSREAEISQQLNGGTPW